MLVILFYDMSLGGLKKQFYRTSQYLSENVAGNKGSEVDDEMVELWRKINVVDNFVEHMQAKTKEYLVPNPSSRTKMAVQSSYHKVRGQASTATHSQPEYNLAEVFTKCGEGLNDMSPYTLSLVELGSSFNRLSEVKDGMEYKVKQLFLDPLHAMQLKELKEIHQYKKKMESRRLEYDYKKNKGGKITVEEVQAAEDKFLESKQLFHSCIKNFVENAEHVKLLKIFSEVIRDYHKQCTVIMDSVLETVSEKVSEASSHTPEVKEFDSNNDVNSHSDNIVDTTTQAQHDTTTQVKHDTTTQAQHDTTTQAQHAQLHKHNTTQLHKQAQHTSTTRHNYTSTTARAQHDTTAQAQHDTTTQHDTHNYTCTTRHNCTSTTRHNYTSTTRHNYAQAQHDTTTHVAQHDTTTQAQHDTTARSTTRHNYTH